MFWRSSKISFTEFSDISFTAKTADNGLSGMMFSWDDNFLSKRLLGYWSVALEGEESNCFSITQLVGQKKAIINSAKKNLFENKTK